MVEPGKRCENEKRRRRACLGLCCPCCNLFLSLSLSSALTQKEEEEERKVLNHHRNNELTKRVMVYAAPKIYCYWLQSRLLRSGGYTGGRRQCGINSQSPLPCRAHPLRHGRFSLSHYPAKAAYGKFTFCQKLSCPNWEWDQDDDYKSTWQEW